MSSSGNFPARAELWNSEPSRAEPSLRNSIICNRVEWKCKWNKRKKSGQQKMAIFWFSSWKKKFKLKEKGHEPSWKYFSLSYSQLASDSSLLITRSANFFFFRAFLWWISIVADSIWIMTLVKWYDLEWVGNLCKVGERSLIKSDWIKVNN